MSNQYHFILSDQINAYYIDQISKIAHSMTQQYSEEIFQHDSYNHNCFQEHQSSSFMPFFHFDTFSTDEKHCLGFKKEEQPTNQGLKSQSYYYQTIQIWITNENVKQTPLQKPNRFKFIQKNIDVEEIEVYSQVRDRYRKVLQGNKDDTVQLNINFKTLLVKYLKEHIYTNQLESEEIKHVEQFSKRSPSFESLSLFTRKTKNNQNINKLCLGFISSEEIIKRILSGRCKMMNKIQMIKFVEILRKNIMNEGKIVRWKDSNKKNY